ncbi:MAG: hypothetical protein EAX96_00825 [Candidatus Lokiarchaeota archaeon]|nr:hypothetical protein [Candidatus Lokiarchaeota archaeon]
MEEFRKFYDEVKSMSKKELVKAGIPKFVGMLNKAKEIGFAKIVKEFPDITDVIRSKTAQFDVKEGINIIKTFMPIMFDTVVDYIDHNKEVQKEINELNNVSLTLALDDSDYAITILIKNGKFEYKLGYIDKVDITLKMSKATMQKFMTGDIDPMTAYMSGEVKAVGDINKLNELRSILNIVSEEFGFDLLTV